MAREETGYVLDEKPAGSKSVNDPAALEEESGSVACESGAASGDAEVLAGESEGDETRNGDCVNPPGSVRDGGTSISLSSRRWFDTKRRHVLVDGDPGEPFGEDGSTIGSGGGFFRASFAEEDVPVARPVEAEVEAADSAAKRGDIHSALRAT